MFSVYYNQKLFAKWLLKWFEEHDHPYGIKTMNAYDAWESLFDELCDKFVYEMLEKEVFVFKDRNEVRRGIRGYWDDEDRKIIKGLKRWFD